MKEKILSDVLRLLVVVLLLLVCGCKDEGMQSASSEPGDAESKSDVRIGSATDEGGEVTVAVDLKEAYQIRNKKFDMLLRPVGASHAEGAEIVLYPAQPWKCLSWGFEKGEKDCYRLKNFYTSKTIEPSKSEQSDFSAVVQASLGDAVAVGQYWRFEKLGDGFYRIVSGDTGLVLTAVKDSFKIRVYLKKFEGGEEQKWELMDMPEALTM